MERIMFTQVGTRRINAEGDYEIIWVNGSEIVHRLLFHKHELEDFTLTGTPVCPACLIYRGIALPMTERTIQNKPFCVTCGGELFHLAYSCSCGEIPHDPECLMFSLGLSGN